MMASTSSSLRQVEEAVGAMRNLHRLLVARFIDMHGEGACETLLQESSRLRDEIVREVRNRQQAPSTEDDDGYASVLEYDPDDVEEFEVLDADGFPTGQKRPKLFAPPLPSLLLEKLPSRRATHHLEKASCPICQEEYCYGQLLSKLPVCHHEFCQVCCLQWLSICGSCPQCRRILTETDFDEQQEQPPHPSIDDAAPTSMKVEMTSVSCEHQQDNASRENELKMDHPAITVPGMLQKMQRPSSSPLHRVPPPSILSSDSAAVVKGAAAASVSRPRPSSSHVSSFRERVSLAVDAGCALSSQKVNYHKPQHVGTQYDVFAIPQHKIGHVSSSVCDQLSYATLSSNMQRSIRPSSAPIASNQWNHGKQRVEPIMRRPLELAPSAQRLVVSGVPPPKDTQCSSLATPPTVNIRCFGSTNSSSPSQNAHEVVCAARVQIRPRVSAASRPLYSAQQRDSRADALRKRFEVGSHALFIGGTSIGHTSEKYS